MEQINNTQTKKNYPPMTLAWLILIVSIFCLFLFNNLFLGQSDVQNMKRPVGTSEPTSQVRINKNFEGFVNNIFLKPNNIQATRMSNAEIVNPLAYLIYFVLLFPIFLSFYIGQYDILIRRKASVKFADWFFSLISLFLVIVTIRLILITL